MVQSKPWVKPLKVVDGEEFFGDDPGMAVKIYVPMPSRKYKF
jgi:hypothetical protein